MPTTYLPSEVMAVIETEMKAYRKDCRDRRRQFSYIEEAANVCDALSENFLLKEEKEFVDIVKKVAAASEKYANRTESYSYREAAGRIYDVLDAENLIELDP